jgi:ribosomal-protein-alanine N-acetyltransferase
MIRAHARLRPHLLGAVDSRRQLSFAQWDARASGLARGLLSQGLKAGDQWVGYFEAMQVLDEVHLLNITVAPTFQRQGWARCLLQSLSLWSQAHQASSLWLEVRESNARALKLYRAFGFEQVGLRKDYYPAGRSSREAAVVMRMALNSSQ